MTDTVHFYPKGGGQFFFLTGREIRNLSLIHGATTDDFKSLAKYIFISQNCTDEDISEEREADKRIAEIEKTLIKYAVQQQFDF